MAYAWDFGVVFRNTDVLVAGLGNTLKITAVALAIGVPLGLAVALLRLSGKRAVSAPAAVFIEFFRTTPPIVQLFWCFFALPILTGVEINPFSASIITFSIQSSAFFAEVFRGGIVSIERGQWEAARAIGMDYWSSMRRIILPQAVKRMIPAFLERAIELMKTTTLVAAIAYSDLLFQANDLAQRTYRPLEIFTIAALMYFAILFPASLAVRILERRLAVTGETTAH
jgi:polar amino acid transport system permease protein